ncbi:MAG TPA: hypothetical protein VGP94_03125 [Tepidisphaeraceae bacterium]|nr:hypothetical protein [Tepidisphaeraceae bacterium]
MRLRAIAAIISMLLILAARAQAQATLAQLLRQWQAEGTAAGNNGDYYDNRDRGHSELKLTPYPGMLKIPYSEQDRKINRDWGAQFSIIPRVVFGNSSTAAHATATGSNTRLYYTNRGGIEFLYQQYTHNNIYVYPEHRDHDPGHNGVPPPGSSEGGYGDLFPANTPYLITSQGSSGTDQAFLKAIAGTLAAFRPEVKKKLVETGLLMPTIQMIFRMTNKHIEPKQYLTGPAHPSAFDLNWVDEVKMAQMAHEIRLEKIPPMVQIRVMEEDQMQNGRDFFEAGPNERHADSPCAIARIFRGVQKTRRIKVSAEGSYDVNQLPLKFHWVILRGDENLISIKPNAEGTQADISVAWHERRPTFAGSVIDSNRVDIGVFAHNGAYYSAPAFITFFCLDSEARTYDEKGNIVEMAYGRIDPQLLISDYNALFAALAAAQPNGAIALLKKVLKEPELAALKQIAQDYAALGVSLPKLRQRQQETQAMVARSSGEAKTRAEEDAKFISDALASAERSSEETLARKLPGYNMSVKERLTSIFMVMMNDPSFAADTTELRNTLIKGDPERQRLFANASQQLASSGVDLTQQKPLTLYQKIMVQQFNAEILSKVYYPGILSASFRANYVDSDMSAPKSWRDVYHHDAAGRLTGWTRYNAGRTTEFNWEGLVVYQQDALGRCVTGRAVSYMRDGQANPRVRPDPRPLKMMLANQLAHYVFADENDLRGRAVRSTHINAKK